MQVTCIAVLILSHWSRTWGMLMLPVEVTLIAQGLRLALPIGHTWVEDNFVLARVRTGTSLVPKTQCFIYLLFINESQQNTFVVSCYCTVIYHLHCHHFVQVSALSGPSLGRKWVQDMYKISVLFLGNVALLYRKHNVLVTVIMFHLLTWDEGQSP